MSPTAKKTSKAKTAPVLNLRVNLDQRSLIDQAAQALGVSRTVFILEAACRAAEIALLDRRLFQLSEEQWQAFNAILDGPAISNPSLSRLLQTKAPWE
jgi:uncharacterized protein (DUF1778 family)